MPTRNMNAFIGVFFFSAASIGCQNQTTSETDTQIRQELKGVTLSNGVSKTEAKIIGESYSVKNVGCGVFTGIQNGGEGWIVRAKFGYAGKSVEGFFIDKRSGKLTSPIGPSYNDPLEIFP